MKLQYGIRKITRLMLRIVAGISVVLLVGCGASPENTVGGFINAVNEGKPEKAVDYVCGDIVLPPLPQSFIYNPSYQTVDNNGATAHVHISGEIRLNLGVSIKKTLDSTVTVTKDRDRWCITKDSLGTLLKAVVEFK